MIAANDACLESQDGRHDGLIEGTRNIPGGAGFILVRCLKCGERGEIPVLVTIDDDEGEPVQ